MIADYCDKSGIIFAHMGEFYYAALYDDSGRWNRPRNLWEVSDSANTLEGQRHFLVDGEGHQFRIFLHREKDKVLWWTEDYKFKKVLEGEVESPQDPAGNRAFDYDLYTVMKNIECIISIPFEGLRNPIPLAEYGEVKVLSCERISDLEYLVSIKTRLQGENFFTELTLRVTQKRTYSTTDTRIEFVDQREKRKFVWGEDRKIYDYVIPIIEEGIKKSC